MKNLFLIDGSGGLKHDILRWFADDCDEDLCVLQKATTRCRRPHEEADPSLLVDLDFQREEDFESQRYDYTYEYDGNRYGFARTDVDDAISQCDNVFIIVRSSSVIRRLCKDYGFINVVPVFVYSSASDLTKRLSAASATPATIAAKVKRSEAVFKNLQLHPDDYREVLIPGTQSSGLGICFDRLIAKYRLQASIDPRLLAVMMALTPRATELDQRYRAIVAAARSVSSTLHCQRVDRIPGSPRIAAAFRSLIARARLVIVDLTESRPNVYYELGAVVALGKACIITAQRGTELAFYSKEHKILFYRTPGELERSLGRELAELLPSLKDRPG